MQRKVHNYNRQHPERGTKDVFVGNLDDAQYAKLPYGSKRRGKKAYTASGAALPGITPTFVSRKEIEDHPEGKELIWVLYHHGLWIPRYNRNRTHPELQEGEIYLGNETKEGFKRMRYATKRIGKGAYGTDGTPIGEAWPVFVHRSELETSSDGPSILKTLLREGIF